MPTNGTPPPTWPVEPTQLFIVLYYPTDGVNEDPSSVQLNMRTYNDAVEKSKELITNAGNIGVCIIQPITVSIVYPSIPWQDF